MKLWKLSKTFFIYSALLFLWMNPCLAGDPAHQLLVYVAKDKYTEAEATLKVNPSALLYKSSVVDYSNRLFENITPFQYALWAYNFKMWNMMLNYMPTEEAAKQLMEFESSSTKYGTHYDFSEILALQLNFGNNCTESDFPQSCNDLLRSIAMKERFVPAHIAHQFTAWDWYPLSPSLGLGYDWVRILSFYDSPYSLCDLSYNYPAIRAYCPTSGTMGLAIRYDYNLLKSIQDASYTEYQNLKIKLGLKIST